MFQQAQNIDKYNRICRQMILFETYPQVNLDKYNRICRQMILFETYPQVNFFFLENDRYKNVWLF